MLSLNILFPVLNEERRLERGIETTLAYLERNFNSPYVLTIVDNGSTDKTCEISRVLCERHEQVHYIRTEQKGVGVAFQAGAAQSSADITGYMDIDLSTDIAHLSEMYEIFEKESDVQIVNASRHNKKSKVTGRKWYRTITSRGLIFLVRLVFKVKSTDVICGFKFFRKGALTKLIKETASDNGWFYIIELLIRAERMGMNIRELPVRWQDDLDTTVNVKKTTVDYIKKIITLKRRLR